MYRLLGFLLFFMCSVSAWAEDDEFALDHAPVTVDVIRLQHGARTFINYCLNCHSASGFRYADLQNLGLSKEDILKYLAPGQKISDFLISAMPHKDAARWFGVVPPDLSWEVRARGADWVYTYLKSFYRDNERPNGWNNTLFPKVNMPNVFYDLEGVRSLALEEVHGVRDAQGHITGQVHSVITYPGDGTHKEVTENIPGDHFSYHRTRWILTHPGLLSFVAYDHMIIDLVSFMSYMADPLSKEREMIGFFFLTWLVIFSSILYVLKVNFWKDVK